MINENRPITRSISKSLSKIINKIVLKYLCPYNNSKEVKPGSKTKNNETKNCRKSSKVNCP